MNPHEPIFVTRSSMPPFDEYVDEIRDIWNNHWLTNMGKKHQQLERELQGYLHVPYVSLMVNGHMALEMTLQAMHLSGDVITTPFTFASTTHAIVRNGLTPVFCDINEVDYTIDVDRLEGMITDKTSAIVPVHVYGNVCAVKSIEDIAKKHHLKVIYDAAHAFGEEYNGKSVASFGDASMLSFHATKVFNTIEGGAVCFKNEILKEKLYNLKDFGIKGPECVEAVGANAKMNEFQAAMGLCNLRHVDDEIAKRKRVAKAYQAALADTEGITIWKEQEGVKHNYAYFPIVVDPVRFRVSRDDIFQALASHGIHARKYFYPLTSSFDCYNNYFNAADTPTALRISNQVLCLPMYADLEISIVKEICSIILAARG